ncbi:alpha-1,4-glucan--maltose-1-phosphate maltosyltransferase [Bradyrhizobium icense]|uniref:Alpha-1,4-glucan:maltose-1-phosphate maltosyltransferase n=1 Tax=Bradyrhizobium icense TaxID=1274631 RepID=A0A1B1UDV9_9BRAD|nr:alpha-1,4-glucan--maltose-1-phosphate maltosyltransferase [Bradyrhizobium icense]ANW00866.1 alpha-1,4-glucan--maltose-1-phosphate maltosyltransferase [Bradyrhizobium icense]
MLPRPHHAMSVPVKQAFHIEEIFPSIDCGRFAVKRIVGEAVEVWADIYRHGHDVVAADLIWRREPESDWQRTAMMHHGNDRWVGSFVPEKTGRYSYAIEAWTDEFATWRHGFEQKRKANVATEVDAMEGASLLTRALSGGQEATVKIARACEIFLQSGKCESLLADDLKKAMAEGQDRTDLTRSKPLTLIVDRPKARYSSWYEMVPRSQTPQPGQHGTWNDCINRLPDIQAMGFDVIYLTPIHPIGRTNRKGRNNSLKAGDGDPGSFYAIGSDEGGHDAIHPQLGSLNEFRRFVAACAAAGMEVALDFAIQCSPDHPWIKQHPEWFKRRPDGSMKYAENPPKKYEDIVNVDFGSDDAEGLYRALRDVVLFWVSQGVKIFRVDNPHTKPFRFWEWLINEVQARDPDVLFLSEAFTRPKVMKGLAKLGFTQSYTYFTWRTERWEIEQYVNELAGYPEREFYRPNFFVSTPDILPYHLQRGEPWMFKTRLALAATLSSNYGIYNGFELLEHEPIPGREEYLNSEKYELKSRDWDKPGNIKPYIAQINRIRRENPALQQTSAIRFLPVEDSSVIAYVKHSADQTNVVVTIIALTGGFREFWLPLGDVQVRLGHGDLKPVTALENLKSGPTSPVAYGGMRLWIDPIHDPVLIFRCLG